jgi:probable sporulation protein (polysaccharide deacetylase family)
MHKKLLVFGLVLTAVWWAVELSPPIGAFVQQSRDRSEGSGGLVWSLDAAQSAFSLGNDANGSLEERIRAEAKRRYIAPVDAKVDSVWKAIPAYNGLEVDIDASLKLAARHPDANPLPVVTREIPAKVQLGDLGPYPVYKGNPNKPMAALMINVAWGEEYLPAMLETLRKEKVHATFFFDGSWLSKHLDTARQIGAQGHELSNHAYSHKNMSQLSRPRATEEIAKTEKLLKDELGVTNRLFAPPSGDFDGETVRIASGMNLTTVLWTLDTLDWRNPGAEFIVRKIGSRVEPGSLILMHPTASSSAALERMIRSIKGKGLALGTVSELLSPQRVPEAAALPKAAPTKGDSGS